MKRYRRNRGRMAYCLSERSLESRKADLRETFRVIKDARGVGVLVAYAKLCYAVRISAGMFSWLE